MIGVILYFFSIFLLLLGALTMPLYYGDLVVVALIALIAIMIALIGILLEDLIC